MPAVAVVASERGGKWRGGGEEGRERGGRKRKGPEQRVSERVASQAQCIGAPSVRDALTCYVLLATLPTQQSKIGREREEIGKGSVHGMMSERVRKHSNHEPLFAVLHPPPLILQAVQHSAHDR